MAETNPTRFDPYRNFKFRIRWDGRYVAGFRQGAPLSRLAKAVEPRTGGGPSPKSPGRSGYDAVTLERGLTKDREFEQWASKAWKFDLALPRTSPREDVRRDVIIEVYNEADQLAVVYRVLRCWVTEYQAMPDLDAGANTVTIEHMTLENEGFERVADEPDLASRTVG